MNTKIGFGLAAVCLALLSGPATAKGCLKGAAVGGVGGHVAGHHALLGAAAGCAVGHHMANKPKAAPATGQQAVPAQPVPAPQSGSRS